MLLSLLIVTFSKRAFIGCYNNKLFHLHIVRFRPQKYYILSAQENKHKHFASFFMSYISVFYFFIMFSLHIVRHQTTFTLQTVSLTKDLILYFSWVQKFGKSTSLSDGKKYNFSKTAFWDKTQDMIQNKKPRYAAHLPAIPGNIKERELRFPGMQVIPCCLLRLSRHRSRCHAQLSSRSP